MKELSIEEKAKAYDKAIAHAKILLKTIGNATMGNLVLKNEFEIMFPELKESENWIPKEIIKYLKEKGDFRSCWIAWLEKQGKNNMGISEATKQKLEDNLNKALEKETPESCNEFLEKQGDQKPKFRVGDTIKCKYDDRQFTIKSVDLDKGTYTYTQEGCGNDIDYADEEFELVEQSPADNTWKPSDEQMLAINTAINVLGKGTINGKYLIELHEQLKKLRDENV